jgi:hypothetical protein
MGSSDYRVDPIINDFYLRLIDLRMEVRARQKTVDSRERAKLETEQLALKILANATSYGIFMELNVEDLLEKRVWQRYGTTKRGERVSCQKMEEPEQYFHPLLGTLITGAARLLKLGEQR